MESVADFIELRVRRESSLTNLANLNMLGVEEPEELLIVNIHSFSRSQVHSTSSSSVGMAGVTECYYG